MKTRCLLVAAAAAVLASGMPMHAQSGPPPAPAVGSLVKPAEAVDGLLGELQESVLGVAKEMPADKYSFAPSAALFAPGGAEKFDGVRTFAGQATHLAQANYFFFMGWCPIKPEADLKAVGAMKTKEQIVPALEASFAYAHKCIATITPENAFVAVKPVDGFSTRVAITAFAAAHGNDHYGQMVEYLRMNGLLPPGSK